MRARLLCAAAGFGVLFGAVAVKLSIATVLFPMAPAKRQIAPQVPPIPKLSPDGDGAFAGDFGLPHVRRATITDRNGQILAISLPMAAVFANPMELIDATDAARKLKTVLPQIDVDDTVRKLSSKKQFVYIARDIPPEKEIAINDLGIPGIYFEPGEKRHYPLGRTAAQVLGAVDVDDHGVAGVERYFDKRLTKDQAPLRLSLDVRVQGVVREELEAAKEKFSAIGACAIVMDVRTGEIVSMVSLPDYDANLFSKAVDDQRFNRAVTGMYEPGSTFKLQTAAMVLETGVAHVWDRFSTVPIHVGRFTISDMKTDHFAPWLAMPEAMALSSNPAAAHMALDAGAKRQQEWLRRMGFFDRVPVELPEAARPLLPRMSNWGLSAVMTVAFGHGVAVPPLAIVRGTAATSNGGILVKPTLLARDDDAVSASAMPSGADVPPPVLQPVSATTPLPGTPTAEPEIVPQGERVLSEETSSLLRRILRMVVAGPDEHRTGKAADIPGYFVGGKTGTAEKVGAHGGYLKHTNITAFTGIFPLNAPRYAVYVMLDSPQATKDTHGWTTSAWNAVPTWHSIVARIAPMMGLFPVTEGADKIEASLSISMNPPVPPGFHQLGPGNDPGDPAHLAALAKQQKDAEKAAARAARDAQRAAAHPGTTASAPPAPRDRREAAAGPAAALRREISYQVPAR
ncbi:penicillin-binding protein 2 [Acetobacteraceae bacterium KSS12]|uniref:Penicillin-binding protein 2 n=2 Tax=Rhizosaccharibacter radicis TaxID=2782605 RepID=A0ABT1VY46_9PROT|nr:penicillin-binding protein 2 [Acetobacteraceae bacterium KSS12]